MWIYEKKLQFPVKITRPDARMAKIMIEQYGGCDGEWGAAHRYLSQRYSMVTPEAKATQMCIRDRNGRVSLAANNIGMISAPFLRC